MTQLTRTDKRNKPEGYDVACDTTGLLITQKSGRGHEHIFIRAEHLEQFLADCDDVINRLAISQKGEA